MAEILLRNCYQNPHFTISLTGGISEIFHVKTEVPACRWPATIATVAGCSDVLKCHPAKITPNCLIIVQVMAVLANRYSVATTYCNSAMLTPCFNKIRYNAIHTCYKDTLCNTHCLFK